MFGGLFTQWACAAEPPRPAAPGYLFCFLGFGVKAAVFPLHGWLVPTASVAPTPVTALLHAVAVVKAGVFAIGDAGITFFSFGTAILAGSYAQYIPWRWPPSPSCIRLRHGASEGKHLKRRLAYSTVSNLSYILFGVAAADAAWGFTGRADAHGVPLADQNHPVPGNRRAYTW